MVSVFREERYAQFLILILSCTRLEGAAICSILVLTDVTYLDCVKRGGFERISIS